MYNIFLIDVMGAVVVVATRCRTRVSSLSFGLVKRICMRFGMYPFATFMVVDRVIVGELAGKDPMH